MNVHPTALISPDAQLSANVEIGPFAVIEGPVKLGSGVKVGGHAWISGDVEIGEASSVGWGCIVGANPQDLGFDPATPSGVRIGPRNTLREYVTIHRGSKPGTHTVMGESNFLMTGVHLAHDVKMGDHNILANNVLLAGHIELGNRAFLGGGAVFHQFIRIGDLAMAQGNAAISQDIPPYCVAHGHNLLAALNTVGMRRAGLDADARAEIKRAFHLLFREGKSIANALAEAAATVWGGPARKLIDAVANASRKGVITR